METTTKKTYPRITAACKRVKEEMRQLGIPIHDTGELPTFEIINDTTQKGLVAYTEFELVDEKYQPRAIILNPARLLRKTYPGSIVQLIYHELVHWYDSRNHDVEFHEKKLAEYGDNIHDTPDEKQALQIQRKLFFEFLGIEDPGVKK